MIQINELHKSYKMGSSSLHVLKGINLSVEDGELSRHYGFFWFWKVNLVEHYWDVRHPGHGNL